MNPIILNVGVAALVGFGRSFLGYLAVIQAEKFSMRKFMLGAATGVIAGALAGAIAQDIKTSIIAALAGDDIRSAATNFYKNK
mgnify:CR=1 FL=1